MNRPVLVFLQVYSNFSLFYLCLLGAFITCKHSIIKKIKNKQKIGTLLKADVPLGKVIGFVAVVLDSAKSDPKNNDCWFGLSNRTLELQTQPFLRTALGPAKLYIVGSLNSSLSYMNTCLPDTTWKPEFQSQIAFLNKFSPNYLEDPEEAINCIYSETISPLYNIRMKCFPSFDEFVQWLFSGPMQGIPTRDIHEAEELYAAYHKSHHVAAKIRARK